MAAGHDSLTATFGPHPNPAHLKATNAMCLSLSLFLSSFDEVQCELVSAGNMDQRCI